MLGVVLLEIGLFERIVFEVRVVVHTESISK